VFKKKINQWVKSIYCKNIKNESERVPPFVYRLKTNAQSTFLHTRGLQLELKHVILLLRQLGHLLPDSLHQCRGGEAAQGHVVHVLHQLGQALLACCARGSGWQLQCLVVLQGQSGGAPLWVARMRKSLYIPGQGHLENRADMKSVIQFLIVFF